MKTDQLNNRSRQEGLQNSPRSEVSLSKSANFVEAKIRNLIAIAALAAITLGSCNDSEDSNISQQDVYAADTISDVSNSHKYVEALSQECPITVMSHAFRASILRITFNDIPESETDIKLDFYSANNEYLASESITFSETISEGDNFVIAGPNLVIDNIPPNTHSADLYLPGQEEAFVLTKKTFDPSRFE